jgi:hypothetical protein
VGEAGELLGVLLPPLLHAPRVVVKASKRAKPINFLFIHSSVFKDGAKRCCYANPSQLYSFSMKKKFLRCAFRGMDFFRFYSLVESRPLHPFMMDVPIVERLARSSMQLFAKKFSTLHEDYCASNIFRMILNSNAS